MTEDSLRDLLDNLRLATDPSLLAFTPDEENQNVLLRNLPAAVLIRDSGDAVILEANDYALKLFGVERKLLVGSTLSDLGLSIHFHGAPSSSQVSGDPRNARITDSQGVDVPAIVFDRKIDLGSRQVDLYIIMDGTMMGGSTDNAQIPRYGIMKSYLNSRGNGYLMAEAAGSATEQDLVVVEASDTLPGGLGRVSTGESIAEVFPQGEAVRLVEVALESSSTGEARVFDSKAVGRIDIFPGRNSLVLLSFEREEGVEETEKDHIVTRESNLSSSVVKTVLLLSPDSVSRDSTAEMLRMLGFSLIEVASPGEALKEVSDTPERFLFVFADLDSVQPETLELMKVLEGARRHLILAGNDLVRSGRDVPAGVKLVCLRKPYGINDVASAVSEVLS